jgi:hypothetical protein
MTLMTNPITQEIREIRHRLAAEFDNDLDRIVADLQRKERESGRVVIDRRGEPLTANQQSRHAIGGRDTSRMDDQSSPPGEQ